MAVPKWDDARVAQLQEIVGDESPVTQATVEAAAEALETSKRSVSSKLRKMEYEVESAAEAKKSKAFSDDEADALAAFLEDNSGEFTYAEIADEFAGGKFTAKQVQGKILSMELTGAVKPTPKKEAVRTYTSDEEEKFLALVAEGAFIEDIADALGKKIESIRGKALSFLRLGEIESMPKQRDVKGSAKKDEFAELGDVSAMTVDQIAEALEKTPRGVKTMLTRRGVTAADYDGAAKKAKLAEA